MLELAVAALVLDFHVELRAATPEAVEAMYASACNQGHALSCKPTWGRSARPGDGLPAFEAACDAGDPVGCLAASWATTEPVALLEKACDAGLARACYELGDATDTRELVHGACEAGEPSACREIGRLGAACEGGELLACMATGDSRGVETLRSACDAANARACVDLASFEPSSPYARELVRFACDVGEPRGCLAVSRIHAERGEDAQAASYLASACSDGLLEACTDLAQRAVLGKGVRRDVSTAHALLEEACDGGYDAACAYVAQGDPDKLRRGCDAGVDQACVDAAGPDPVFLIAADSKADSLVAASRRVGEVDSWTLATPSGDVTFAPIGVDASTRTVTLDQTGIHFEDFGADRTVLCIRAGCPTDGDYDVVRARAQLDARPQRAGLVVRVAPSLSASRVIAVTRALARDRGPVAFLPGVDVDPVDPELIGLVQGGSWRAGAARERVEAAHRELYYGNLPGADHAYRAALAAQPGCGECLTWLAIARWADDRTVDALFLLQQASALHPDRAEPVATLAGFTALLGDQSAGAVLLTEARTRKGGGAQVAAARRVLRGR